ncbi:hypothetical protein HUJ05_006727 [Dendroctonus ponderosae]|nr:hypothetical protein HUJ05_006726 [Dendroctonus ponderosae]KAH1019062.1 hypothetical protein HUJ05_006727 [Dendroctonus ponderosae]
MELDLNRQPCDKVGRLQNSQQAQIQRKEPRRPSFANTYKGLNLHGRDHRREYSNPECSSFYWRHTEAQALLAGHSYRNIPGSYQTNSSRIARLSTIAKSLYAGSDNNLD